MYFCIQRDAHISLCHEVEQKARSTAEEEGVEEGESVVKITLLCASAYSRDPNIPSNAVSMNKLCTYQESTSDISDTSSITAVSGSPPRSLKAHSDEDDKRILSWAEDVANSDSDDSHTVCPLTFRIQVNVYCN